ncbi:MAG TPA: hypothetical protein VHH88_07140 [Verrucomicrobiae bacterium]|nr:hypothetical protein [Verrucomicrobiae bacterium]
MNNRTRRVSYFIFFTCALLAGCASDGPARSWHAARVAPLRNVRATYCASVRTADHRIDVDRIVRELVDEGANTYSFCIHAAPTDWDDLKRFLPLARKHGIRVWASVVPPSESPPRLKAYAEPFRLDYQRWAVEFAKLSLKEPNLVAWSIDDFTHNLKFYTPDYVRRMVEASHRINPKLAFVPCCYYPAITPGFVEKYCPLLDGILFPYRHESAGANLKDPSLVEPEIHHIKEMAGERYPVVLDIYATAHSRLGASTPEYVEEVMERGHRATDAIMIYRHQDPKLNAEKYQIIKRLFHQWAGESRGRGHRSHRA